MNVIGRRRRKFDKRDMASHLISHTLYKVERMKTSLRARLRVVVIIKQARPQLPIHHFSRYILDSYAARRARSRATTMVGW